MTKLHHCHLGAPATTLVGLPGVLAPMACPRGLAEASRAYLAGEARALPLGPSGPHSHGSPYPPF